MFWLDEELWPALSRPASSPGRLASTTRVAKRISCLHARHRPYKLCQQRRPYRLLLQSYSHKSITMAHERVFKHSLTFRVRRYVVIEAEMGDRARAKWAEKCGSCCVPFRKGSPANTMSPGPKPTSVPSGILIHPAISPQQIWAENWGPFFATINIGRNFFGGMGILVTQSRLGRSLPPYQVAS